MPKILNYNQMQVDILQATHNPAAQVGIALSITMKSDPDATIKSASEKLCGKLIRAQHTSVFEHIVYCFLIEDVSRSFLAQITRQRTASPTSGSQHYQDYSNYACAITPHATSIDVEVYQQSFDAAFHDYKSMLERGLPKEEARQVLPNAACVNYLWTIDARNLMFFLQQRLCNRNVLEMRIFAHRVLSLVREHFPELFNNVGPQCHMDTCYQGELNMQCKEQTWDEPPRPVLRENSI